MHSAQDNNTAESRDEEASPESDGNEGVSVNKEPAKTPTAPESRENPASEKEPSATSEEVDTSDIPDEFEETITDPMMGSVFTWKDGRWVAPE